MSANIYSSLKAAARRASLALAIAMPWHAVHAAQIADLGSTAPQVLKISRHEPTRIAAERGRIAALRVKDGLLSVEADEENGQLFISVRETAKEPAENIHVFITLDDGTTSTLTLQPADLPADTILVRRPAPPPPVYQPGSTSHTALVRRWLSAMANGQLPQGAQRRDVFAPHQLAPEVELVLETEFADGVLTAERYRLRNRSAVALTADERMLYRPGVLAVAIDQHALAAGEATAAYVLREAGRE